MSECIEVAYLTKIEKSNINADSTQGNITVLKKTHEINGDERVYVSGESVKYSIKEYWKGLDEVELSPIKEKTSESQVTTACDPEKFIDDDLFGFMDTEEEKKRTAPVKTNGLISLFPWTGDINQGVRFSEESDEHSMHNLEITTSVMRGNFLISLDRVGNWSFEDEEDELDEEKKNKRVQNLMKGIFNLWGGANQTNYLTDIKPEAVVIVERNDKAVTIGDKFRIDENYNIDINTLKEILEYNTSEIEKVYFGAFNSFIGNLNETKEELEDLDMDVEVKSMSELKDTMTSCDFY